MLPVPQDIVKSINKIIYKFLWNGVEKIKRTTLINDIQQGGVSMIDIESQFAALKAAWVPRFINSNGHLWYVIGLHYLNSFGKNLNVLNMNFESTKQFEYLKKLPPVYQEMLLSFNKCKHNKIPTNKNELYSQSLWGNIFLTINNKTLFSKRWIDSNILRVCDALKNDGSIDTHNINARLQDKSDLPMMCYKILHALKPYKYMINSNDVNVYLEDDVNHFNVPLYKQKSKFFYKSLVEKKQTRNINENQLNEKFNKIIDFDAVYLNKVVNIYDRKVAEFCYKSLTNTLSCNLLLFKSKIKDMSVMTLNTYYGIVYIYFVDR